MFKRKKCKNCGERIEGDYRFCPYCGFSLKERHQKEYENDFGLLGRNDFSSEEFMLPRGFNTLINSLFKNLNSLNKLGDFSSEKDLEFEDDKKKGIRKKGGIGISIYSSGNKPPEIKVTSFGNIPKFKDKEKQIKEITENKEINFPKIDPKKFLGLPKKEPETAIRRLSDKIIYEIRLPGVKSMKDISIVQLENSIEIKAKAKDHIFYKIISLDLPIREYNFSKEKLVLELEIAE
ncbi:zinc ribbon domain-containing protein [Patescibacteria group bacterium]|nr:zinc ribbon domain-containing protein [Patescibacteria group bacterium]